MTRTCESCLEDLWPWEYSLIHKLRKVFISFGGLLLYMEGPYKNLTPLRIDYVYLCVKK